jgi:hypothetical protein
VQQSRQQCRLRCREVAKWVRENSRSKMLELSNNVRRVCPRSQFPAGVYPPTGSRARKSAPFGPVPSGGWHRSIRVSRDVLLRDVLLRGFFSRNSIQRVSVV